jgi:hypothetical protein
MGTFVIVAKLPVCDIDPAHGAAKYDAKTVRGPWANLCRDCFEELGIGLGTGRGQELRLEHEVVWADRRSFNHRLRCTCGWESRLHLMERDVLTEGRQHLDLPE